MFLTNSSSINSCNFGVLVGGGMLRVFLLCYLGYSKNFFFFFFVMHFFLYSSIFFG